MTKKKAVSKPVTRKKSDIGLELKSIKLLTPAQSAAYDLYGQGRHLFMDGSSGTGKTFLGLHMALSDYFEHRTGCIKIVRSTVPSRNMGFMPGTLAEKLSVYEGPYAKIVNKLMGRDDAWGLLQHKGVIELVSTSYLRGMTFDNTTLVFDEIQNCTIDEIATVVTRAGKGSRIQLLGDYMQNDLKDNKQVSGFRDIVKIVDSMPSFARVVFTVDDIVRDGVVAEFIRARHKLGI